MPLEIRANLIAGNKFEWEFTHRVVAARQDGDLVRPTMRARPFNDLPRQMHGKSGVVSRVNEFRLFLPACIEIPVAGRADAQPEFAQRFEVDGCLQTVTNVARR